MEQFFLFTKLCKNLGMPRGAYTVVFLLFQKFIVQGKYMSSWQDVGHFAVLGWKIVNGKYFLFTVK